MFLIDNGLILVPPLQLQPCSRGRTHISLMGHVKKLLEDSSLQSVQIVGHHQFFY